MVALGASAVLGVVAGVLVATTGPEGEVGDPSRTPTRSSASPMPSPSTVSNPAALRNAPSTTESATPSPTPTTRSATPTPGETDDNRGRGQGRGGNG